MKLEEHEASITQKYKDDKTFFLDMSQVFLLKFNACKAMVAEIYSGLLTIIRRLVSSWHQKIRATATSCPTPTKEVVE